MSLNKAQFQVAFNRADALDNLKSATIAAKGRDKMIANLNRMSNLDNPWAKMTAYSALSRFAPVYQQEQIEKLGGGSDLQKTYMKDIGEYFAEKTANRKREQELAFKVEQAQVFGEPIQSAGGSNIDVTFAAGRGSGWAIGEEGSLTYRAPSDLAQRLAEIAARQEIPPAAMGGGEAPEVPQALEPVKKRPSKKVRKPRRTELTEEEARESLEQAQSYARVMDIENPEEFAIAYDPEAVVRLALAGRKPGRGRKPRSESAEASGASTLPVSRGEESFAGLASFEQPALKGGFPEVSSIDDVIAAALARAPPPDDIIMDDYIAYREYLLRFPSTGTYKKFRKERSQKFVSASGGGPAMGFGGLWR